MKRAHDMPFGAAVTADGGVRFRLWAPGAAGVDLRLEGPSGERRLPMDALGDGWHQLVTDQAGPGTRYRFRPCGEPGTGADGGLWVPDPASRFNPDDVHGPSEVIDPAAYTWQDGAWRGRPWEEAVVYELHVGSFTPQGSFRAVIERLDYLKELGVTALELMPVADFPGRRNWGYDGVLPFAPDAAYGRPEDLKALVDAAHACGLMVFLDVVYNHFGPEGNYLHVYARRFFTERHHTPWGAAINYDGEDRRGVRDFFIHNALYWLTEYHLDGLRLDAVHAILDDSRPDILEELAAAVAAGPGRQRRVHLVLENDDNAARYLERGEARAGGYAAQWNDDLHHALHVLVTGEADGYYAEYAPDPARHLARCLAEGFAWQGEPSAWRDGGPRGEPSGQLPPAAFVAFLQNHDQTGNRALGERLHQIADPDRLRAAVALLLLQPQPPLLFMGEEFAAATPFLFFCDFGADLRDAVREGRRREFAGFARFSDPAALASIPDPGEAATFLAIRLAWSCLAQAPHREWLDYYRALLALRHERLSGRWPGARSLGARALGPGAVHAEWRLGEGSLLTLYANLGPAPVHGLDLPDGTPLFAWPALVPGANRDALPPACVMCYLQEAAP